MKSQRGMTLIELLVVIAVIGLISALLFPSFSSSREAARIGASKQFSSGVDNALGGSPFGWWDFSECSGSSIADRSGNLYTLSMNGNPQWDNSSDNNPYSGENQSCAVIFTGSSNQYLTNTTMASLSGSFTISVWVKPSTAANGTTLAIMGSRTTGANGEYSFDMKLMNGNLLHADIGTGSAWMTQAADASFGYSAGKWYHIVYTLSSTGYKIYANGNQLADGSLSGAPLLNNPQHKLRIGTSGSGPGESFNGSITIVHIFPAALASGEIKNIYAQEKGLFNNMADVGASKIE